jgi:anti-sigma B factor antagonist
MELNWRQMEDGAVVIAVDGELDLMTAPQLRELLVRAIERDSPSVTTLDLEKCTFIDTTVIGVIVEAGQLLDRKVQRLRIANLREQPKQVFELTLVDRAPFIEIVEDVPAALGN